jgi:hypothetical protein
MEFKPTIFIGSSREGLKVAKAFERELGDIAEIRMWPNIFELSKSNFDNLVSQIAFHDYAILVATPDDTVFSRQEAKMGPRDNVLFEFGLFTGGLGASRVFFAMQKDTKIPSDVAGITLPFFPKPSSRSFAKAVAGNTKLIREHIENKENTFDLGFLPSTALAYGYFYNFVEKTIKRLLEDRQEKKVFTLADGSEFIILSDLRFTILIPDDLQDDMFKKVASKKLKSGWKKMKVDPKEERDYDFNIDVSKAIDGELHLMDIPLTLNALNKAVELYSKKEHLGKSTKEELLEYREIRNFKRTLDYLISTSALARDIATTEIIKI